MSQDGSNLFGHQNFQTSPFDPNQGLYHTDITMQFAATVPHRQPSQQQQHLPMSFQHPSFQNQEVMMPPHQQFSLNYPGSPYERSESVNSCATNNTGKQLQSKAERRAEHNAIERARRESLNVKFQQLAFTLPNLQNDSRPSKSTIIDRTLDFVKGAILKEDRMQYRIKELEKFSRYLLSELDKKSSSPSKENNMVDESIDRSASTSPLTIPAMIPPATSSPPSGSVMSEDSITMVEEIKFDFSIKERQSSPPYTNKRQRDSHHHTTGIKNRRPVSRSSVPAIPNLEYNHTASPTNWPTPQQQQQQQLQLLEQQQHQMMMKDQNNTINNNNTIFQQQFQQNQAIMLQKFQDHTITEQNTFMNNYIDDANSNYHHMLQQQNNNPNTFNHNLMEQEHHQVPHLLHRR